MRRGTRNDRMPPSEAFLACAWTKNLSISMWKAGESESLAFCVDDVASRMSDANRGQRANMKLFPRSFSVSVAVSLNAPSMKRETMPISVILEVKGEVKIASVISSAIEMRRSWDEGEAGCFESLERMVTRKRSNPRSASECEPYW